MKKYLLILSFICAPIALLPASKTILFCQRIGCKSTLLFSTRCQECIRYHGDQLLRHVAANTIPQAQEHLTFLAKTYNKTELNVLSECTRIVAQYSEYKKLQH